jgi:hypothetical protein
MLHVSRTDPDKSKKISLTRCSLGYLSFTAKAQPNRRKIGNTMTVPGHRRKLWPLGLGMGLALAAVGCLLPVAAARAGTTEEIVIDRLTGLAINGYDPVAYFVDGKAVPGQGEYEYAFAGAVWRFRNEGNRAAFVAAPEVYMPQFGGYDPIGVARGVALPGDPRLWHLARKRLYLFRSADDQARFVLDEERMAATADRKWPLLQKKFVH